MPGDFPGIFIWPDMCICLVNTLLWYILPYIVVFL